MQVSKAWARRQGPREGYGGSKGTRYTEVGTRVHNEGLGSVGWADGLLAITDHIGTGRYPKEQVPN